jgi:HTH-type transcriptional regulator / antitoxin HigA
MEEHDLKQTDLAEELGGQSVASAILNGKRELNARQVKALPARFNVSPAVFL